MHVSRRKTIALLCHIASPVEGSLVHKYRMQHAGSHIVAADNLLGEPGSNPGVNNLFLFAPSVQERTDRDDPTVLNELSHKEMIRPQLFRWATHTISRASGSTTSYSEATHDQQQTKASADTPPTT
jgi:hypothetical protein